MKPMLPPARNVTQELPQPWDRKPPWTVSWNGLNSLKEACGVDKLKMSEFGITPDLFDEYAKTAFSTMGNLFELDRCKLTPADVVSILEKSYS